MNEPKYAVEENVDENYDNNNNNSEKYYRNPQLDYATGYNQFKKNSQHSYEFFDNKRFGKPLSLSDEMLLLENLIMLECIKSTTTTTTTSDENNSMDMMVDDQQPKQSKENQLMIEQLQDILISNDVEYQINLNLTVDFLTEPHPLIVHPDDDDDDPEHQSTNKIFKNISMDNEKNYEMAYERNQEIFNSQNYSKFYEFVKTIDQLPSKSSSIMTEHKNNKHDELKSIDQIQLSDNDNEINKNNSLMILQIGLILSIIIITLIIVEYHIISTSYIFPVPNTTNSLICSKAQSIKNHPFTFWNIISLFQCDGMLF